MYVSCNTMKEFVVVVRERIGEEEGEKEGSQGKGGWEERKRECG